MCTRIEMSVVDAILRMQKLYCDWLGVGSLAPLQIIVINLFVPTQHPIFTPGPDNR